MARRLRLQSGCGYSGKPASRAAIKLDGADGRAAAWRW
jgi:hypothetical protein